MLWSVSHQTGQGSTRARIPSSQFEPLLQPVHRPEIGGRRFDVCAVEPSDQMKKNQRWID